MKQDEHIHILKRTGAVLLAVGCIDIGVMIYCIAHQISYSSSFNIFAVAAGVFLLRGSLRAASAVRWVSIFMLSSFLGMLISFPLMQPIDLTLMQMQLAPSATAISAAIFLLLSSLLWWLAISLGKPSVLAARAKAGRPNRDMRRPASLGIGLALALLVSMHFMLGGASATKAQLVAQKQLGYGYKYHVASLNVSTGSQGTSVRGIVTAWNASEIRDVPVAWDER